ncbi:flagellar export protein FliJ [Xenophilus sp. AP218F]|nr:flagellar export protein FliJ [Chromobacterium sp. ASV5]OWY39971.1 flagellar export protein FliJ [Xenophilus sp. AP218F]
MSADQIKRLGLLVQLRERDKDKLEAELAKKRRLQERYQRNIERLDALCAASGASGGAGHPALALNRAGYKGHLQQLLHGQRQDLKLAEADAAVCQRALLAADLRREQVALARAEAQEEWRRAEGRREQKLNDELAGQAWLRGRVLA